ncbi:MAG: hypothetical protein IJ529_03635 [Alphaproteobacteria bacterium]|nr:hypothetical protein [Alphaproteobacteria bacterium]
MNTKYDTKLNELEWYKRHPLLLPFIGNDYDEYKILQIGESHYIPQNKDNMKFDIKYFIDNWWDTSCDNKFGDWKGWFYTRGVIEDYLDGYTSKAHGIFNNVIKCFSKCILEETISDFSLGNKQIYNNFAFMNFFQMPSIFEGKKYWNSLVQSANNREVASKVFRKCTEVSIKAVDDVIHIIDPKIIIFTSISAKKAYTGEEYKDYIGKYKDDNRVIYTSHPSASFSWNKKLKTLHNKTGEQVLEEGLFRLKHTLIRHI